MIKPRFISMLLVLTWSVASLGIMTSLGMEYHVANEAVCANDNSDGLYAECDGPPGTGPWRTIKRAEDEIAPGDTVTVHEGTYWEDQEIYVRTSGTESRPIVFRAQGRVIIKAPVLREAAFAIHNPSGPPVEWVEIDGFEIEGEGVGLSAAVGIGMNNSENITIRNNKISGVGTGILAPNCSNILVENNEVSDSYNTHGIYFSCGGAREVCSDIVIRGNHVHHNNWAGIQLSAYTISDLVYTLKDAVVENNVIEYNAEFGPAQLSAYSVENSTIRDNTIRGDGYTTTGITLWRQESGGGDTTNNVYVQDNCISMRQAGRGYTMHLLEGSEHNVFEGNTFIGAGEWWPTILIAPGAFGTVVSNNYNYPQNLDQ